MVLTAIEESLVLAAYYRGGSQDDQVWTSNTDQILTLSLYFTGDIPVPRLPQRGIAYQAGVQPREQKR